MRKNLNRAYKGSLMGYLEPKYGKTEQGRDRRWAEMVELSFERRAGQSWLLFKPWTWIASLPRPENEGRGTAQRAELDPASAWRSEVWAQRRQNEVWAALIAAWSELVSPDEQTELTVNSLTGTPLGRIVIGRTNAYSRPA